MVFVTYTHGICKQDLKLVNTLLKRPANNKDKESC